MAVSLERKYRPKNLTDMIGNERLIHKLIKMSKDNSIPQTMIFYGPPGNGKTTSARILAKEILCLNKKPGELACNTCDNCTRIIKSLIEGGQDPKLPVYEKDIGQMGRTEDIMKIVSEMMQRTVFANKRVYILDEAQRMSPEAQARLLKITEEPPEGLYIFLCTTHPEQLLEAIMTRFRHMQIKKPAAQQLADHLESICIRERIDADKSALSMIAKYSDRTPRKALIKLEELAKLGPVRYSEALSELQSGTTDVYMGYLEAMSGDPFYALEFIADISRKYDMEYKDFLKGFSGFLSDLIKIKAGVTLDDYTAEETKRMGKILKVYTMNDLGHLMAVLLEVLQVRNVSEEFLITSLTLKARYPEIYQPFKSETAREQKIEEEKEMGESNFSGISKEIRESAFDLEEEEASEDLMEKLFGSTVVIGEGGLIDES